MSKTVGDVPAKTEGVQLSLLATNVSCECGKVIPEEVAKTALVKNMPLRCGDCKRLWSIKEILGIFLDVGIDLLKGKDPNDRKLARQPLPKPSLSDTIRQARDYIDSRIDDGVKCPCCNRNNKRYVRPLDSGIVRGLVALVRASPNGEIVHVKDIPPLLVGQESWTAHDFAKARFWGLCEEVKGDELPMELLSKKEAKKRRKGFWRSTEQGRAFVFSMQKVPKYIILVNNEFQGMTGEPWSIQDALGEHFDFYKLTGQPEPSDV